MKISEPLLKNLNQRSILFQILILLISICLEQLERQCILVIVFTQLWLEISICFDPYLKKINCWFKFLRRGPLVFIQFNGIYIGSPSINDQCSMLEDLELHYGTFPQWSVYFDLPNSIFLPLVADTYDSCTYVSSNSSNAMVSLLWLA